MRPIRYRRWSTRTAIAKISNTGVLSTWNAGQTTNYTIYDMAINGSTIYFRSQVSLQDPLVHVKGFNTSTATSTGWELNLSFNQLTSTGFFGVQALAISGARFICRRSGRILLGGVRRNYLAAIDLSNYTLKSWNPSPNGEIFDMELYDGLLYVGGDFDDIDQFNADNLAAINSSGHAVNWFPNVNGVVYTMVEADGQMFFGGSFSTVNGSARSNIASVDIEDASLYSWNPGANNSVTIIEEAEDELYVAGDFTVIGGQSRLRLASFLSGLIRHQAGVLLQAIPQKLFISVQVKSSI